MELVVQIRMECIKLAHRHDLSPQDVVARAGEYEKYVSGDIEKSENHSRNGLTGRRGRPPSVKPA